MKLCCSEHYGRHCIYTHACVCVCVCVCVYIYIYIHTHTHTLTCVHLGIYKLGYTSLSLVMYMNNAIYAFL